MVFREVLKKERRECSAARKNEIIDSETLHYYSRNGHSDFASSAIWKSIYKMEIGMLQMWLVIDNERRS